jgi:LysR family hydrogen peroxide-inducible transcriptional activator
MDIKDLKYIVKICETKSFSLSAKLLFISQPALSQSIKRIEHEIGVKLFYRNKHHIELTDTCKFIYKEAKQIIDSMETLERNIYKFSSPNKKNITLGISQFYGRHFLKYFLDIFKNEFDNYHLNVLEGESHFLENQIVTGNINFGLFPYPIYSSQLSYETIFVENIMLAIQKNNKDVLKLLQYDEKAEFVSLTPAFRNIPFILLKKGLKLRSLALEICKEFGFVPQAVFESENLDTVLSLVENNYGIAFLPNTILINNHAKDVLFFRLNSKLSYRKLMLVYNSCCDNFINIDKLINKLHSNIEIKITTH